MCEVIKTEPNLNDHLYLNLVNKNPHVSQGNQTFIPAIINSTQTQSILSKTSEYNMSIVRFAIGLTTIPLYIFRVEENPLNPNDVDYGQYIMTIRYNNTDYSENVIYVPINPLITVPNPPVGNNGDYSNDYYFIYTHEQFLTYFNTCLSTIFTTVKAANPELMFFEDPYFYYNSETKLIEFYVDERFIASNISIWYNHPSEIILYEFFTYDLQDPIKSYQILLTKYAAGNNSLSYNGINWIIMYQQYLGGTEYFSAPKKLLFETNSLPIKYEDTIIYNDPNLPNSSIIKTNRLITDFIITDFDGGVIQFQYTPSPPGRLIKILNDIPLRNINMSVFWVDDFNEKRLVYLHPGSTLDMKILFLSNGLSI